MAQANQSLACAHAFAAVQRLVNDYGGITADWKKRKGIVNIQTGEGVIRQAEVHWYERAGQQYEYRYIPSR